MPRRRSEYDYDEDEDLEYGRRRGRDPLPSQPTTAGMIGFVAAMVSLAFLIVVAILYFALRQEDVRQEVAQRTRLMYYWFLFLDVFSFFAALCAIIFTSRGLSPTNPLYRGWATAGLVLGIAELIATLLFGLYMSCSVLLFEALRGVG